MTPNTLGSLDGIDSKVSHTKVGLKMGQLSAAINHILSIQPSYIVQAGDTVGDLARHLGVHVPTSLYWVKPGDEWKREASSIKNTRTGTTFPIRLAA